VLTPGGQARDTVQVPLWAWGVTVAGLILLAAGRRPAHQAREPAGRAADYARSEGWAGVSDRRLLTSWSSRAG
jgi:hypothetical protein